jgi:chlorophyll/bacteriochlorophyll a synthase
MNFPWTRRQQATQPGYSSPLLQPWLDALGATLRTTLGLMKPVTWFAPAWAFLCGALASNALAWSPESLWRLFIGLVMSGPILVGVSQVINDYCDREVDAINEPQRLIPSGKVTAAQVYTITIVLTLIGAVLALYLGRDVALLVGLGLVFAVSYSMHPMRAKRNGWIGNALVAFAYEGLAWLAGHVAFGPLSNESLIIALLYSLGAHGIMTINDFKSIDGDRLMGIRTIPVQYGEQGAAWLAIITMNLSQLAVMTLMVLWGHAPTALIVLGLLLIQIPIQLRFLDDPRRHAVFYNATGTMLFVWGMLAVAIGL